MFIHWEEFTRRVEGRHWSGIRLLDDSDEPVPGERYEITLPNSRLAADSPLSGSCPRPARRAEFLRESPGSGG